MNFYWIKTSAFIKRIFSQYIWSLPNTHRTVYLTFDDGPTPEITEWTLSQLKKYNAKATFFCIGTNIEKHPEIFNAILEEEHSIGNHTFNHANGWKTKTDAYLEEVRQCDNQIQLATHPPLKTHLFRPPYGKIKPQQAKKLLQLGYKIVMWDILSADFDQTITPEKCLENVVKNVKSGSIIVFHDSAKGFKNLEFALPKTLEFLKEKSTAVK